MTTQEEQQFCDNCGAANPPTARFCQHCATLLPFAHSAGTLPEQTLLTGRYQLVSRIGQGGMGAVYKAIDTRFNNRPIAIKEMSSAGLPAARLQEAEAAFEREAHLLADLLHPNLPRIYDSFTENERSYLVMDFIEGETIEEYLEHARGGPLPVETVLKWAEQLCDVLNYLHTHQPPIVFRDLKPANVMISENGHLYLIDFGIARIFKPGKQHDTVALGSPGYAAPEQYGKAQSTPRSDIYSLGALLHHLLTGVDPSEQPFFFRPASQLNPAVDSDLEALLQQMLEMDADKRPASAQDVLNRLQGKHADGSRTSHLLRQPSMSLAMSSDPVLADAYRLYTQKRLDEALKAYEKAVKNNTNNALAWQGYGLAQRMRFQYQGALTSFEKALQLDPSLVPSMIGKGIVLSSLNRHSEAVTAFDSALKQQPNNAAAWNGKGVALKALGRSQEALTAFETALRLDPHLIEAWNNKGLLLSALNRQREALDAFDAALNLNKNYAPALFGRGQVYYEQHKLKQALRMFEAATQSDPKFAEAWNRRGNLLDELGDPESALKAYDAALNIDARHVRAWCGKAGVLRQLGRYYEALKAYEFALTIDANYSYAWNGKGNTLYNLGQYSEALNAYERALRLNPRLTTAWHNKSLVLYRLNRYDEALQAADEAIRLRPDDPDHWLRRAESLKALRQRKEARRAESEAMRLRGIS
jgi:serine/threonine protein kinase